MILTKSWSLSALARPVTSRKPIIKRPFVTILVSLPGTSHARFWPTLTVPRPPKDKAPDDSKKKKAAHEAFQAIAFAYAVLSDPARRKRYDETGSTSESIVDADGFNWSDYYRAQFKDAINSDAIEQFSNNYKGSDEERSDLLAAFELFEGDMDQVYETVILSDPVDDDERFRKIIDEAIASREVPAFRPYLRDNKKSAAARAKKAMRQKEAEAEEAEAYAKELGVHDKIFGGKKGKGGKKPSESSEDGLAALIQKRQQDRSAESFLDHIADKYGASSKKKGKKRAVPDEPPEEAFAATAARKRSKEPPRTPPRQTGSRAKR